jgi:hypothetical protein
MADKEGKGLVDENEFLEIMMTSEWFEQCKI